jgi:ATP-binding protein involved in chromosome partitioning
VTVELRPGSDKAEVREELARRVDEVARRVPGVTDVRVAVTGADQGRGRDPFAGRASLPGVQHVIAVASGKGGVGKSTVAVNLALALAEVSHGVGIADMDVYGPSLPMMLGIDERPQVTAERRIRPLERYGLKVMSMGFFLDEQSPVIWRGPIVMGIVRQFLHDVDWAPLEFLIVDLPPGTGDAVLTLVQQVPLAGGVIVTTPQDVALLDVGRGMAMLGQVSTPVLGVVENMAAYVCPSCGTEDAVFGAGGAERLASHFDVPLLAQIPLALAVREGGDRGLPILLADPAHPASATFRTLAARVAAAVRAAPQMPVAGVSA